EPFEIAYQRLPLLFGLFGQLDLVADPLSDPARGTGRVPLEVGRELPDLADLRSRGLVGPPAALDALDLAVADANDVVWLIGATVAATATRARVVTSV